MNQPKPAITSESPQLGRAAAGVMAGTTFQRLPRHNGHSNPVRQANFPAVVIAAQKSAPYQP